MAGSKLQSFWNHPAGPKTIFFWAPTVKWGISIANVVDFSEPPERISYPQQVALMCTGLIYSRFSMVITPKNWNLFGNSIFMAGTGLYQVTRKIRNDVALALFFVAQSMRRKSPSNEALLLLLTRQRY